MHAESKVNLSRQIRLFLNQIIIFKGFETKHRLVPHKFTAILSTEEDSDMTNYKYVLVTLTLLFGTSINAQKPSFEPSYLSSFVNEIKEKSGLPSGTAIAVIQGDRIIYQGNYGYKNIAKRLPVDRETQFYIASTTKPMTALNFLIDAKDDPVLSQLTLADMFPEFSIQRRRTVKVEQLILHTASIKNLPLVLATAYSGVHSPKTLTELINTQSVMSSEGIGEFNYTNVGYNIYSVFSDSYFESSWQQKLSNQIFKPAGMTSTTARMSSIENLTNIAKTYSVLKQNGEQALYLSKVDSTMHSAGGVYSTSSDLARFLIAHLNSGRIDGKQVYPPDIIAKAHIQQTKTDSSFGDFSRDGYAWGWYTGEYKKQRMLHHFGGFAGIHAHLSFIPEQNIGLVILNNEDFLSAKLTEIVADYVYGSLLGEKGVKNTIEQKLERLKSQLSGIDNIMATERNKIMSREWKLSLPIEMYIGDYYNALLGTLSVSLNHEDKFDIAWGVLRSKSTGMNKLDQVRVELDPTRGSVIHFNTGQKVESLIYNGIVFDKK